MAAKTPSLTIDAKILAAIYSALKSIPDRRNTIPICGMLHLEASGASITVTATDCDIEAAVTVECRADFAPVCLPPFLIEAAAGLGVAEVKFAIDERQAVVTGGRARFAAPILPGADFPKFRPTFTSSVEIGGGDLAGIIGATVDAASNGADARFYLEGVFLVTDGERLHSVATDGHRLHTSSIAAPSGLALNTGIIVPIKAANEIVKLCNKAGGNSIVLATCDRAIAVTYGGERVTSKLIDGTYPDWRRVVPAASTIAATFDLAEMLGALDRVMKIQEINESGVKAKLKAGAIKVSADNGFLVIAAAGTDVEARDEVRAEIEGEFGVRGVSAKYLRATLAAMKERGGDTIRLDTPEAGSPMRLESPTDEDFLAVVMPMRV